MLGTYIHGVDDALALEVLGPGAVPDLRRLLKDPDFPRRDNVVAFLAHLDRGAATRDLLAFLSSPPASLDIPEEDRAMLLAPQALGHIASRGDAAALAALLEMTLPGEWGPLDAAAAHAADPDSYHADLLEAAFRGLAFSREGAARQRLADLTSGRIRFRASSRDLIPSARSSLELLDELTGRVLPKQSLGPAGAHLDGALSTGASLSGGQVGGESLTGGGSEAVDIQTRVHNSPLTYANHVMVTNPMTDARLDQVISDVNIRTGRADFLEDVECCVSISRSGTALTFGTSVDGLDLIDNGTELSSVLNNPVARVKVVRAINWCGGPVTNIIGCAGLPGNGMAVVRQTPPGTEGILWMHEYGHNTGSGHNPDPRYIMYANLLGGNNAVSQAECNLYHFPMSGAGIVPTDIGACSDNDADGVQDLTDNCPGLFNDSQVDFDEDHIGDPCDPDDDNDGTSDLTDCSPLNNQVWGTPSEALDLLLSQGAVATTLSWTAPSALGSASAQVRYEKLQSGSPSNFMNGTLCIPDGIDPTATSVPVILGGPPITRESDQFFASFGGAVAATDVNNDGFSDVIVG
ncbi:MAG TPA: FG-GAP repeat protein, partial [Candidatus Polarisedimenticolia bacterium]|nr:FG-GAP repeat protein [Candidatus Polarisedimenticolia bacterium]